MFKFGKHLALLDEVAFLEIKACDSTGGSCSNARLATRAQIAGGHDNGVGGAPFLYVDRLQLNFNTILKNVLHPISAIGEALTLLVRLIAEPAGKA